MSQIESQYLNPPGARPENIRGHPAYVGADKPAEPEPESEPDLTPGELEAETELLPVARNAAVASRLADPFFGHGERKSADLQKIMFDLCERVAANDIGMQLATLGAQAASLDAAYTGMLQRAVAAMDYPDAAERWTRMAFAAQAQCRATVEAIERIVRCSGGIVRNVYVDNRGGQAVIAGETNKDGLPVNVRSGPR